MRTSVSFYAPHPLQIETLFQNQSQDMAIHYCNQIAVWSYVYEDYRDFCLSENSMGIIQICKKHQI